MSRSDEGVGLGLFGTTHLAYANAALNNVAMYVQGYLFADWIFSHAARWLAYQMRPDVVGKTNPVIPGWNVDDTWARLAANSVYAVSLLAFMGLYSLLIGYDLEMAMLDLVKSTAERGRIERDGKAFFGRRATFALRRLGAAVMSAVQLSISLSWALFLSVNVVYWLNGIIQTDTVPAVDETWIIGGALTIISLVAMAVGALFDSLRVVVFGNASGKNDGRAVVAALRMDVRVVADNALDFCFGFLWGYWPSFTWVSAGTAAWFGRGDVPAWFPVFASLGSTLILSTVLLVIRGVLPHAQGWDFRTRIVELVRFAFCFITSFIMAMWGTFAFVPSVSRALYNDNSDFTHDCSYPLYPTPYPGEALAVSTVTFTLTILAGVAFDMAVGTQEVFPSSYTGDVCFSAVPHFYRASHYPLIFTLAFSWAWLLASDVSVYTAEHIVPGFKSSCPYTPSERALPHTVGTLLLTATVAVLYTVYFLCDRNGIVDIARSSARAAMSFLHAMAEIWTGFDDGKSGGGGFDAVAKTAKAMTREHDDSMSSDASAPLLSLQPMPVRSGSRVVGHVYDAEKQM